MNLCPECQPIYDSWINFRQPYIRWIQFGNKASSVDAYHRKAQERRELVRQQLAGISRICATKHTERSTPNGR